MVTILVAILFGEANVVSWFTLLRSPSFRRSVHDFLLLV